MGGMGETPRSEMFDDVYFSASDGAAETEHVFLNGNNLPGAWQGRERFTIAETGFGTGLNFLMAWELFDRTAAPGAFLDFISVEKFPLKPDAIRESLSPWAERLSPYLDKMLTQYPILVPGFHRIVFDGRVALTLIFGDANEVLPEVEGGVDAWFLDGFTPSKNPDMWTDRVFGEMARLSHGGTSFATFTAAGFVKRGLRAAGFSVEKRKGFGSKRDMLAGVFDGAPLLSSGLRGESVHILGAGLAGCSAAYVLKQYGFAPVLHDPHGIASGASGNPVGIVNPRIAALRSVESDVYTAGFAMAAWVFPMLDNIDYVRCGSIHLATDAEKQKRFSGCAEQWGWDAAHMRLLNAQEASDVAGVSLDYSGLYLTNSAMVGPAALCRAYAKGVAVETGPPPEGAVIVLANGAGAAAHPAFADLPIHTVRGQITMVEETARSAGLKTNIHYGGYISAPVNGVHAVGATFQKWLSDTNSNSEDDADNLKKLQSMVPAFNDFRIVANRASLRTASQDRFPVVGRAENVFVTTAHGSHGIVTTLAAAHIIADYLRGGPFSVGKSSLKALSPARFALRAARKKQ